MSGTWERRGELIAPLALILAIAGLLAVEWLVDRHSWDVVRFPLLVGGVTALLCGVQVWRVLRQARAPRRAAPDGALPTLASLLWLLAALPVAFGLGFVVGLPLYALVFLKARGEGWGTAAGLAFLCWAILYGLFVQALGVALPAAPFGWS